MSDTKFILTGYNFVAPLNMYIRKMSGILGISKLETLNEKDGAFELLNGAHDPSFSF